VYIKILTKFPAGFSTNFARYLKGINPVPQGFRSDVNHVKFPYV
jgi:hypothetical protein